MSRALDTAKSQQSNSGPTPAFIVGKNKIINGDFSIWQRGTSFTPTNGSFTADRWKNYFDGSSSTRTYSRQSFTPGAAPVAGYESSYFIRLNQSVAGSGGTYNEFNYQVEDVRTLSGQTATLSFWAKAAATTILPALVLRQVFGSGGGQSVAVDNTTATNISLSTSWTRYSYTITLPSISGKIIGPDINSSYLQIIWSLPLNSTFTVDMWGVQLEAGSTATPFQTATGTIQGELAACQRYYWRNTQQSANETLGGYGNAVATTIVEFILPFPVFMRIPPTSIDSANLAAGDGVNARHNMSSITFGTSSYQHGYFSGTVSGATQFRNYNLLNQTSTTAYIGFSAEL